MMDNLTLLTSNIVEDYQERLRDSARQARIQAIPQEPVMRRRLGRMMISLGERIQGQRAAHAEPAQVQFNQAAL
ncbi:MAG TPA: hypothetical protein VGR08_06320 [Thermomicrobiales bacterium]|nr:hypothetical protein [Thermomicrobiales bacterium]